VVELGSSSRGGINGNVCGVEYPERLGLERIKE
jgi:hypothetical protein